ncbi:MAG TPA: hypothetical protein VGS08_01855 [Candidatus Saccharimonadales bacterium]|nr:hypothetical protein [Candidatus Saccharimonadales bacterium]
MPGAHDTHGGERSISAQRHFSLISKTVLRLIADVRQWNHYCVGHPYIRLALNFTVLFAIFWGIGISRLDPDFGWHLQTGRYIWAHGIPAHDIFTYTAHSFAWIDHEWGNDVILSVFYSIGGYQLVSALYAALWALAVLVGGGRRCRILVLLPAALAITEYAGNRPLAWSACLLAAVLSTLRNGYRGRRWYLYLPLLFAVWANLHAGFVAGLAVIGYYALLRRRRLIFLLLLLSISATLINPYGPRLYEEIYRTLNDPALHHQIAEWAYFYIPETAWLFVILWLAGLWIYRPRVGHQTISDPHSINGKRVFRWVIQVGAQLTQTGKTVAVTASLLLRRQAPPASVRIWLQYWLRISVLLFLSTLSATRNLPFFVVGSVREFDDSVSRALGAIPKNLDRRQRFVAAGLLGLFSVGLLVSGALAYAPWGTSRLAEYPIGAVVYLRHHACSGNLFNDYNYGGYLIWQLPNEPVYIDGRMPTWRQYMDQYEATVKRPTTQYARQFHRYNIRCALLRDGADNRLKDILRRAGWEPVVQGNGATLLLKPT